MGESEMLNWLNDAVFYEIYPISFFDSNGDGKGDLKGIAEKADYLKELGINAVWLNPIYKSPFKDGGYDTMYGTDGIFTSSYQNLSGEKLLLLNNLWEELKSDVTVSGGIYVICSVIVVTLVGFGIFFAIRKKKRNIY